MNIIEETYAWAHRLSKRSKTTLLVLHHEAGKGSTPQQIHNYHLSKGWAGIAYHYYVRQDGKIYRGRPEDTIGGHTLNYNSVSIGICFEGNFENETMTDIQKNAGRELVADICKRYPGISVKRHKDLNQTACPGKNFPFDYITTKESEDDEAMDGKDIYEKLTAYLATLPVSDYAKESSKKAVESGLFSDGDKDGMVDNPRGILLRQDLATVMNRAGQLDK